MATELVQLTAPSAIDKDECETSNAERNLAESSANTKQNHKSHQGDKKRDNHHRRKPSKKKRKWKPYSKMTWKEKKAVEEREKIRADRIRGEMMDRGRPVAPYNTTQFIMAEHDPYEEDSTLDSGIVRENENDCNDGPLNEEGMDESIEDQYTDSPHMAPEFISQDFSEAYERVQEESLSTMTRDDLVKEHLSLERTLSYLQEKLADEKNINNSYSTKVENLEEELENLRKDNERLARDNMRLVFGNDSVDNIDTVNDQTSDYEYEVPTSDQEAIKYSEDYNDVGDQAVRFPSGEDATDSSCSSEDGDTMTSRPSNSTLANSPETLDSLRSEEADYEALSEESDSRSGEQRKKRRHLKKRDRSLRPDSDVTSSSYDDTVQPNQSDLPPSMTSEQTVDRDNGETVVSAKKYCPFPNSHLNKNDDEKSLRSQSNPSPISDESSRSGTESQRTSSTTDVIMQSQKTHESMDAESFPSEEKTLSSVSMQSLTPED